MLYALTASVEESPVSVLDRVAAILDVFGLSEELTLVEVARRADLPRSSVHRMLQQLVDLEWVERRDYAYRLGVRMRELGNHALLQDDIHRAAIRPMYDLRDETGLSVHLTVLVGTEAVTMETVWGRSSEPALLPSRYPAYATACGKVLLAGLPEEKNPFRTHDVLPQSTPFTISSPRQLAKELHKVRELQLAVSREELGLGVVSVAVPVGPIGASRAAMGISGPVGRFNPDMVARALRRAAAQSWTQSRSSGVPRRRAHMRSAMTGPHIVR